MAPVKAKLHQSPADTSAAVDAFMLALDHPLRAEIELVRGIIVAIGSTVAEGVKWNAPSFRTTQYFATVNLREKAGLGVILHLGAKVRDTAIHGLTLDDPGSLLRWLAKDRATVVFKNRTDLLAKQPAFAALLKQWITYV